MSQLQIRHAFLHSLMHNAFMTEVACKDLYASISGKQDGMAYVQGLRDANEQLAFAKLRVKTVKSPVDGVKYVGFVNTIADEPSKLGSHFSIEQRDFFRQSMEHIAQSTKEDGGPGAPCSSEIELLNMLDASFAATQATQAGPSQGAQQAGGGAHKLSKQQKAVALREFIGSGWLASAPTYTGHFCLGPRTFLELGAYLMSLPLPEETRAAWEEAL